MLNPTQLTCRGQIATANWAKWARDKGSTLILYFVVSSSWCVLAQYWARYLTVISHHTERYAQN